MSGDDGYIRFGSMRRGVFVRIASRRERHGEDTLADEYKHTPAVTVAITRT